LVLKPRGRLAEEGEDAANRFAGAFLVPEPVAKRELGDKRRFLDLPELYALKREYGLSMQAWIIRARDLHIITPSRAGRLFAWFNKHDRRKVEPGDPYPQEEPRRFVQLVWRAWSEDLVSDKRAAELLGIRLPAFRQEVVKWSAWPTPPS